MKFISFSTTPTAVIRIYSSDCDKRKFIKDKDGFTKAKFTANLTDSSGPIVSDISFTTTLNFSNYTVECSASGPFGSYKPGPPVNCTILIAGVPSAPVPNNPNFTSDALTFSWSPSTSPCLSHYSVNVTSIEYTINTTDTSLSLPVPSTNDTEYSISVVAVDTGGRYSDAINNVTYQTDYPTYTNETVNITVSWDPPQSSYLPPVTQYNIQYNISNEIQDISTDVTSQTLSGFSVGVVYTVSVEAVNVLGTGTVASATISISATPSPTEPTLSPGVIAAAAFAVRLTGINKLSCCNRT
uniref:Fibronectin type-III domain-containing protein n=1 Tax=Amphimedon queenslandica TaxID=400682 RepID=A0A1X7TJD9_AMPQE